MRCGGGKRRYRERSLIAIAAGDECRAKPIPPTRPAVSAGSCWRLLPGSLMASTCEADDCGVAKNIRSGLRRIFAEDYCRTLGSSVAGMHCAVILRPGVFTQVVSNGTWSKVMQSSICGFDGTAPFSLPISGPSHDSIPWATCRERDEHCTVGLRTWECEIFCIVALSLTFDSTHFEQRGLRSPHPKVAH